MVRKESTRSPSGRQHGNPDRRYGTAGAAVATAQHSTAHSLEYCGGVSFFLWVVLYWERLATVDHAIFNFGRFDYFCGRFGGEVTMTASERDLQWPFRGIEPFAKLSTESVVEFLRRNATIRE